MKDRNLLAVSIKHTEYKWKFGMPCLLWGHRTADEDKRSFGGYTLFPEQAELYELGDFEERGYSSDIVKPGPVHMGIGFCKKWKQYDTVLVPFDEYVGYCKMACLATNIAAQAGEGER